MFVLMSLKLGHLGPKTRSPGQIIEKCLHSRGPIFEVIIMTLGQNVCLMISMQSLKLGYLRLKTRSPGQIKEKPF